MDSGQQRNNAILIVALFTEDNCILIHPFADGKTKQNYPLSGQSTG